MQMFGNKWSNTYENNFNSITNFAFVYFALVLVEIFNSSVF
jgi:hypothetical protein